jgi:hypothetical protein
MVVRFYLAKLRAAAAKARMEGSEGSIKDQHTFISELEASVDIFRDLTELTYPIYKSISDVPANVPERLKVCPYHWTDILPLYERELQIYKEDFQLLKDPSFTVPSLPGLAGIRYADAGFLNPRKDYSLLTLEFDFSEMSNEKSWSAEWFGYLKAPLSVKVIFYISSDRGAVLTVGNEAVIDWKDRSGEMQGEIEMKKGHYYPIHLAYDHAGGDSALLKIDWCLENSKRISIPPSVLFHSPAHKRQMDRIFILSNR